MNLNFDLRSCPHHSPSWCEKHLTILNKKANVVPLVMNVVQADLSKTVTESYAAGRPCRIIILKADTQCSPPISPDTGRWPQIIGQYLPYVPSIPPI